jgi:putative NADH-flavin reductase
VSKIIVFGSAGRIGSRVVGEAVARGHDVVAVVSDSASPDSPPAQLSTIRGDVRSAASIRECAGNAEVIVITVGGTDKTVYADAARAAVNAVNAIGSSGPRIIHLGGGASLLNDDGIRFVDAPGFPETVMLEASGQAAALDIYRASTGVRWTYLSPPPGNFAPGKRTGRYRTGHEHPVVAKDGSFSMSFEDAAVAIVDEIEHPLFIGQRFTIGY